MANLNTLEARVAAATQSLVGQQGHAQELLGKVAKLEEELTGSRADLGRLQGELGTTRQQCTKLDERVEQLSGENRRLIGETNRYREEVARFERDTKALREERDKLTAMLDALVDAVESGAKARAMPAAGGEVVEMLRPVGETCALPAREPDWSALRIAKPAVARVDPDSDIPNEAARKLMDRIRDRIEAHRA